MGLVERLNEIIRALPDSELAQVVDFAEALKGKHGDVTITVPDAVIDLELMRAVRSRSTGGFTWRREDLYDRGLR
jgi:hypothetical protein